VVLQNTYKQKKINKSYNLTPPSSGKISQMISHLLSIKMNDAKNEVKVSINLNFTKQYIAKSFLTHNERND